MAKVLVVGAGGSGRQHALGWALARSPLVEKVYFAPGNGGTSVDGENVGIDPSDFENLVVFAKDNYIDLTVVGPEAQLIAGIVDRFRDEGLVIFGPNRAAAELEGSKAFTADFLERHDIPRPMSHTATSYQQASEYVHSHDPLSYVIKADGLAGGKGVVLPSSEQEADKVIADFMKTKIFGSSGDKVVFQERLYGQEVSAFALSDGKNIMMLPCFQDYKQAYDGDRGPNTGGIGVYGPLPFLDDKLLETIRTEILQKTIDGMRADGRPFRGMLYPGLFITKQGDPKVIEYNCRFGDPETQALVPLLDEDLYPLLLASATGTLKSRLIKTKPGATAGVVLCSGGYPGSYKVGKSIQGFDMIHDPDIAVFHGCTDSKGNEIFTTGGRVLTVTAYGENLYDVLQKVYHHTGPNGIHFENMHYRTDIGSRLLSD